MVKVELGAVVTLADAAVTEIVAAAGFDFAWKRRGVDWLAVKNDTNAMLERLQDMRKAAVKS